MILELLGMSRAGKTTQKQLLKKELDSEGSDVSMIERPKIPFSKFNSLYHFHNYLVNYFGRELEKNQDRDFVIVDRGAHDRQVLLELDYQDGNLSRREYGALSSDLRRISAKTNLGFLLMVSPEESISRWESQKEKGLDFSHLNKGLPSWDNYRDLKRLHDAYLPLVDNSKIRYVNGKDSVETNLHKILGEIRNAR